MFRRALAAGLLVACGSDSPPVATPPTTTPDGGASPVIDAGPVGASNGDSGSPSPAKRTCLADPVAAVNALSDTGVLLGYQLNGFFDPSTTKHWEGVARLLGGEGKFLAVSRIGPEMFDIVDLASRAPGGEAFGASRATEDTAPPADDEVVVAIPEDEGFEHAGGLQTFGDILAVPLENGTSSRVIFYDVATPTTPKRLGSLERPTIGEAGSAGWIDLPDRRLLLVVGRKDDATLDFYFSKTTTFDPAGWDLSSTWAVKTDGVTTTLPDGDENFGDYQNLDVIRACDDRLFLLGTHREGILVGDDFVDLYALTLTPKIALTKVAKRHMICDGQCNLDAAAGAYITPSGSLHVYAIEHDNDGPGGAIKMKEF